MDNTKTRYAVLNEQSPEETASLTITTAAKTTDQIVDQMTPIMEKAKSKLKKIKSHETFFRKGKF